MERLVNILKYILLVPSFILTEVLFVKLLSYLNNFISSLFMSAPNETLLNIQYLFLILTSFISTFIVYLIAKKLKLKRAKLIPIILLLISIPIIIKNISRELGGNDYCPSIERSFSYEGCSTTYTEIIKQRNCIECGYVPCIHGFEYNRRIDILECLCSKNKTDKAKAFSEKYLEDISENKLENVCNSIPTRMLYL